MKRFYLVCHHTHGAKMQEHEAGGYVYHSDVQEIIAAKDAEIARLKKIAERYQWLVDNFDYSGTLDSKIDAAITAEKEQTK